MNQPPEAVTQPKTYLAWVDHIKGLSILGIVLFHFFQNYPDSLPLVSALARLGAKVGFMSVDLFFLIAGFNISYSLARKNISQLTWPNFNWKAWLVNRLKRLYPSFFYAVILILVTYGIFDRLPTLSFKLILSVLGWAGLQFQVINPGFWFFTVILEAYLLTPLFYHIFHGRYLYIGISMLVFAVLTKISTFMFTSSPEVQSFLLSNNFIGSYIGQYALGLVWGICYWNNGQRFKAFDFYGSLFIFFPALVLYGYFSTIDQDFDYMSGFDLAFTPLTFLLLYSIFTNLYQKSFGDISLKPLSVLGKYSYQIFLVHQPILFVCLPGIVSIFEFSNALSIFLTLIISMLFVGLYVCLFIKLESIFSPLTNRLFSINRGD